MGQRPNNEGMKLQRAGLGFATSDVSKVVDNQR